MARRETERYRQTDVRKGLSRGAIDANPPVGQREIALRVVVGLPTITRCTRGAVLTSAIASARESDDVVGMPCGCHRKRSAPDLSEAGKRGRDSAGFGVQARATDRASRAPSPERSNDLIREVRNVDDDVAEAGPRERLDLPREERLAACLEGRLRRGVGKRRIRSLRPAAGIIAPISG